MTAASQGVTFKARPNYDPDLLPRVHKRIVRHCNQVVMEYHAENHLEEHFKPGAGRKYGYAQRRSVISLKFLYRENRAAYDKITKLKGKDGKPTSRGFYKDVKAALGLDPLVFTGRTREMVTSRRNWKITATPARGKLVVRTPNYVASRLKSGKQGRARQMQREALKRAAELEVMTVGEIQKLQRVFRDEYLAVQRPDHPMHAKLKITFRQRSRRRS
jgi:hypothetical protein